MTRVALCLLALLVAGGAVAQSARNGGPQACEEVVCPAGEPGPPGEDGVCVESCEARVCITRIQLCDRPENPCDSFRGRYVCTYDLFGKEMLREKPKVRPQKGQTRTEALEVWADLERHKRGCVEPPPLIGPEPP